MISCFPLKFDDVTVDQKLPYKKRQGHKTESVRP